LPGIENTRLEGLRPSALADALSRQVLPALRRQPPADRPVVPSGRTVGGRAAL